MTRLVAALLRQRVQSNGAAPLITYYDLGTGERTELSATSFRNWVDKTANLLADDLLLGPGTVVQLDVARRAPGHWVTLVLELASWQVGATVRVAGPSRPRADLLVLGPDWHDHDLDAADEVLACSLHPLGLGFASALPPGVVDFSTEVRGQSDVHSPAPLSAGEPAWIDDDRELTQADLVDLGVPTAPRRRLVPVTEPWPSARDGVLVPLLTGGSAVLVVGDDPERLSRLREAERVDD